MNTPDEFEDDKMDRKTDRKDVVSAVLSTSALVSFMFFSEALILGGCLLYALHWISSGLIL